MNDNKEQDFIQRVVSEMQCFDGGFSHVYDKSLLLTARSMSSMVTTSLSFEYNSIVRCWGRGFFKRLTYADALIVILKEVLIHPRGISQYDLLDSLTQGTHGNQK